jgi:hypothetical protein
MPKWNQRRISEKTPCIIEWKYHAKGTKQTISQLNGKPAECFGTSLDQWLLLRVKWYAYDKHSKFAVHGVIHPNKPAGVSCRQWFGDRKVTDMLASHGQSRQCVRGAIELSRQCRTRCLSLSDSWKTGCKIAAPEKLPAIQRVWHTEAFFFLFRGSFSREWSSASSPDNGA